MMRTAIVKPPEKLADKVDSVDVKTNYSSWIEREGLSYSIIHCATTQRDSDDGWPGVDAQRDCHSLNSRATEPNYKSIDDRMHF